jgi:hypothetical protein
MKLKLQQIMTNLKSHLEKWGAGAGYALSH